MKKGLTLLFLAMAFFGSAQQIDKTSLDAYFDALARNDLWMGNVALMQNGQFVYTRAVGFSDVGNKQRATETTRYRIGSISKTFTTVLVFKAIEAKKLALDDKLSKWFPKIVNADKITIGMMLAHRSGIHSFTDDADYLSWNTQKQTEAQLLDRIVKGGSDFAPDSKTEYSNSNFVLLSFILEKVHKKPIAQLLKEQIAEPLKLNSLGMEGRIDGTISAHSYQYTGKWEQQPQTDLSVPLGAGSVVATAEDVARFFDALFHGKLLSADSLEKMKTIRDGYGMGLFKFPFDGKKGYGHTGGIDGFSSMVVHFDQGDVTAVRLSNGSNYKENDISIALLSAAFDEDITIPSFEKRDVSALPKGPAGTYSSPSIPLKITIREADGQLFAQATGQMEFGLEKEADGSYTFAAAGIRLTFDLEARQMTLAQGGGTFVFTKE